MTEQRRTSFKVSRILRLAREEAGLSVADLSAELHIAVHHINALEDGRYGDLPGTAYATGFIRNIADHLGLKPAEVLALYAEETGKPPPGPDMAFRVPASAAHQPSRGVLVASVLLLAVLLGLGWLWQAHGQAVAAWFADNSAEAAAEEARVEELMTIPNPPGMPQGNGDGVRVTTIVSPMPLPSASARIPDFMPPMPGAESPADALPDLAAQVAEQAAMLAEAEGTEGAEGATVMAAESQASPSAAPVPSPLDLGQFSYVYGRENTGSRIAVEALGAAWIRVTDATGEHIFTQTLTGNEIYRVPDLPGLRLRTGNAGAVRLITDGKRGAVLGEAGAVRSNIPLVAPPLALSPAPPLTP